MEATEISAMTRVTAVANKTLLRAPLRPSTTRPTLKASKGIAYRGRVGVLRHGGQRQLRHQEQPNKPMSGRAAPSHHFPESVACH